MLTRFIGILGAVLLITGCANLFQDLFSDDGSDGGSGDGSGNGSDNDDSVELASPGRPVLDSVDDTGVSDTDGNTRHSDNLTFSAGEPVRTTSGARRLHMWTTAPTKFPTGPPAMVT